MHVGEVISSLQFESIIRIRCMLPVAIQCHGWFSFPSFWCISILDIHPHEITGLNRRKTFVTLDTYWQIVLQLDCSSVRVCFESCVEPVTVCGKQAFGSPAEVMSGFPIPSEQADVWRAHHTCWQSHLHSPRMCRKRFGLINLLFTTPPLCLQVASTVPGFQKSPRRSWGLRQSSELGTQN